MGYSAFVCAYVCVYIYFVHDQPRLRQHTSKLLVFPISCDVRAYTGCSGCLTEEVISGSDIVGEIGGNFSEKFSLGKTEGE